MAVIRLKLPLDLEAVMAHVELGAELLSRVRGDVDDFAKIESMPKMEGRQMTMVLAPK